MTELRIHRLRIPLTTPLVTAIGTIRERRVWLVEAIADGLSGWGEAAPLPGFGGEPPEQCELALERARTVACDHDDVHAWLTTTTRTPAANAAITGAHLDLCAQRDGMRIADILGGPTRKRVRLNALAGSDGEVLAAAAAPAIKIKSCGDPTADAGRVRSLLARRPGLHLRLDANGSWEPAGAANFARLAGSLVEYVEQPFPPGQLIECARLRELGVRIALDEGVRNPTDLAQAVACQACDAVVIKPNWIGGSIAAMQMIALAAAARIDVILSSALGTAVERMHAAQIAIAIASDFGDRAHGLATGHLLERDVAIIPMADPWTIAVPDRPGLGIAAVL